MIHRVRCSAARGASNGNTWYYTGVPVLFYDLETFGRNAWQDRIAEFAGIVTDDRLDLLEQPTELRCIPPPDYLAHPGASLTNGITPVMAQQTGVSEPAFARRIRDLFLTYDNTLIVGYNNASFDDEFIRHLFYRTFVDPYEWHYRNGNARLDMLSVIPGLFDFHREELTWPRNEDGKPDFRLEALSVANQALGGTSHEALADTFALRNVCRAVSDRIPETWKRLPSLVDKRAVEYRLRAAADAYRRGTDGDLLVFSTVLRKEEQRSSTVVLVVGRESGPAGRWWVVDTALDPEAMTAEDPEAAARSFFRSDGAVPRERLRPLLRINPRRFPFLFAPREDHLRRLATLGLPVETVNRHAATWRRDAGREWIRRFLEARNAETMAEPGVERDVDGRLYDGFPAGGDRRVVQELATLPPRAIVRRLRELTFEDDRYRVLATRFFGRYAATAMSDAERTAFRADAETRIDVASFDREWCAEFRTLSERNDDRPMSRRRRIMEELRIHRNTVAERFGLGEPLDPMDPVETAGSSDR